tara:strand:- start:844 stop:1053 length:210 start_codon:yes stop_codon:yes gene_type:complete
MGYSIDKIMWFLGIALIVLKLTGLITWPWLWVTAPLWIGFAGLIIVLACILLFKVLELIMEFFKKVVGY